MRAIVLAPCLILSALILAGPALPQVIAPELEHNQVEVGWAHTWFSRDMAISQSKEIEWEDNVFFIRYGVLDRATIFGEGAVWDRGDADRYPGRDYRVYRLGAGATARLAKVSGFSIFATAYYGRAVWFDRSAAKYHKEVESSLIGLAIAKSWGVAGQEIALWAGPAWMSDTYMEFPWWTGGALKWESEHDFGGMAGLRALVLRHVSISYYFAMVDRLQPRIAFGYTF